MTTSLAIRRRNQSLINGEEASGDEDPDGDGPPAKRARTGRVILDAEEAAFARSLPPLRPNPGAMSQYKNIEREGQGGDGGREDSDQGDADAELGDGGHGDSEDEQEGVGFLDNGVCSLVFLMKSIQTYSSSDVNIGC